MTIQILEGNCLDTLKTLPEKSVQCCVTSPPYYGLRDYGTAKWEGDDSECDHKGQPFRTKENLNKNWDGGNDIKNSEDREFFKEKCGKCGAVRVDSQIGLERTPDKYVENLVAVFREVRRVLKDDGVLWLNLGDSYCNTNGYARAAPEWQRQGRNDAPANNRNLDALHGAGYKTKDLLGIPWMVAFALRNDGWYLRSDIIWAKPNPMPESVTDRPTKSHEYIFLLSKSKKYYYDQDAIREPYAEGSLPRALRGLSEENKWSDGAPGSTAHTMSKARSNVRKEFEKEHGADGNGYTSPDGRLLINPLGRNKWTVWNVPTQSYSEAHFATFPDKLIEPCILAGSKKGDTVLDPFSGSGTTGEVALRYQRNYIGCELNPKYIEMTMRRLNKVSPMLIW